MIVHEPAGPAISPLPGRPPLGSARRRWRPAGTTTSDGRVWVLLSHRSPHVQASGTWSTFGGAIDAGETPWQAAVRETAEEIRGIDVGGGTVTAELEAACPHGCGWTYTTFAVRVEPAGECLPRVRVARGEVVPSSVELR